MWKICICAWTAWYDDDDSFIRGFIVQILIVTRRKSNKNCRMDQQNQPEQQLWVSSLNAQLWPVLLFCFACAEHDNKNFCSINRGKIYGSCLKWMNRSLLQKIDRIMPSFLTFDQYNNTVELTLDYWGAENWQKYLKWMIKIKSLLLAAAWFIHHINLVTLSVISNAQLSDSKMLQSVK